MKFMENSPTLQTGELIDERELSKLKWRCRRGLLENDIFLERFFRRFECSLTALQASALRDLMDLSDNDLLDLLLNKKSLIEIQTHLNRYDVSEVLKMLKEPAER